jgi:hypothetical protein
MNKNSNITASLRLPQMQQPDITMSMCVEGALVWHNFDDKSVPYASTGKTLTRMHAIIPNLRWETRAVAATSTGWMWQAAIRGTAPGGEICAHSVMIVTLNDEGLITQLDEYIDPSQLSALRG